MQCKGRDMEHPVGPVVKAKIGNDGKAKVSDSNASSWWPVVIKLIMSVLWWFVQLDYKFQRDLKAADYFLKVCPQRTYVLLLIG